MARSYKRDSKGRFSRTGGGRKGPVKDRARSARLSRENRDKAKKKSALELRYYGESRKTATPYQMKNRRRRTAGNAVALAGVAVAGAAVAGNMYLTKNPAASARFDRKVDSVLKNKFGREYQWTPGKGGGLYGATIFGTKTARTKNTRDMMKGVKRSRRTGVYNITTAKKPRRGYR